MGVTLLQTCLSLSESMSRLVIGLTSQPELMAKIRDGSADNDPDKSLVELTAETIQKIFTSCLGDRTSGRFAPPKGKKTHVYIFANLTLRLLFAVCHISPYLAKEPAANTTQCGKSRFAVQMFTNLSASGPALSLYPASQRVTFLYNLGRFYFDFDHFYRAHMCLEEAYRQCPPTFQKHRRQILTFWIPSNLLLGRFPSIALLQRPEAAGFYDIFVPICAAVRAGNFLAFQAAMAHNRDWLWAKGLYVTLFTRLKQLVWRSFTRRIFLLTWQQDQTGGGEMVNKAAVLSLEHVVTAAQYVQKLLEGYVAQRPPAPRAPPSHVSRIYLRAVSNSTSGAEPQQLLAPARPRRLMPMEGLVFGNKRPELETVEPIVANLVYAGFLNGFIARQSGRFAVEGAKKAGGNAVRAGWPPAWQCVMERFREDYEVAVQRYDAGEGEPPGEMDDVPGWVRSQGWR